jgi:hypothetical protein
MRERRAAVARRRLPSPVRERGRGEGSAHHSRRGRAIPRRSASERNEIIADFHIREADHAHAVTLADFSPSLVVVGKPFVLFAVELHRELGGVAVAIDDKPIEGNLPPVPGSEPTRFTHLSASAHPFSRREKGLPTRRLSSRSEMCECRRV